MATPARFYSSIAPQTSLTAGITAIDTTIMVASTTGFPGSTPYTLALDYGGANEELVDVTAQAGLSLTVTRAVDSTSASTHNAGAVVRHVSSARDFTESRAHEAATENVHGVTGVGNDVVGTTSTQTLSNKTLNRATGTLQNVDLFNVGAWVTSVIGDSTQASLSKFAILNNEVGLQEMAVFTGNGALYSYKQAGDVDGSYRIRVTDTDTTTDRFFVLAGGATKVVPTAASTFPAQDIAAPDTSTSKRAIRVSANGGGTERFTVWNSGQMDVTPTSAATSGLNVRVTSGSTPVTRFFAANPGPQTADLTQWVDQTNTIVARVDKSGVADFAFSETTAGITYATNFGAGSMVYRTTAGVSYLAVEVVRTGATFTPAGTTGNVSPDLLICTLPVGARPPQNLYPAASTAIGDGTVRIETGGDVYLVTWTQDPATITNGSTIRFTTSWIS